MMTIAEMKKADLYRGLKQAGYTLAEAKQAGYIPYECLDGGYSQDELLRAGWSGQPFHWVLPQWMGAAASTRA